MKKALYILLISILFISCSDFQKALKSEDIAAKFEMGTQLFEAEKYNKAHRLFAQIVPNYRGKPQAEKLMFMYAMSSYKMKDFFIAGYQFERFVTGYPTSEKVEEAAFLAAKSYYELSPVFSKEQKETIDAIEKLQLFINAYPDSQYLPEANVMIQELDFKLEKKAFTIASQYNKISDYKASVKSFNNFMLDFPGSQLRKEALFQRFEAQYNLAVLSIKSLKLDRINTALSYFETYKKAFPNDDFVSIGEGMKSDLLLELKELNTETEVNK